MPFRAVVDARNVASARAVRCYRSRWPSRNSAKEDHDVRRRFSDGARSPREPPRSGRRLLRRADRAGPRELPHLRRSPPPLPRPDPRLRHGEDGRGARELRLRTVQRRDPEGDRGSLPGAHGREAPRRVPARRLPGGRRDVDEHERERGDRQSRPRADGAREGRVQVLQRPRPRERLAVDERRLPDVPPRRPRARERPARGGDEGADRGVPGEGEGVRRTPQDGSDAAPGRRPDDPRAGVQRLRRDARRRGRSPSSGSRTSSARSTWGRRRSARA